MIYQTAKFKQYFEMFHHDLAWYCMLEGNILPKQAVLNKQYPGYIFYEVNFFVKCRKMHPCILVITGFICQHRWNIVKI